jgi:hypothetical protein
MRKKEKNMKQEECRVILADLVAAIESLLEDAVMSLPPESQKQLDAKTLLFLRLTTAHGYLQRRTGKK